MGFKLLGKGGDAEMWKFRSCPRCGGDVFLDSDEHVWYEHCLQCGYIRELKGIAEFNEGVNTTVPAGRNDRRKGKSTRQTPRSPGIHIDNRRFLHFRCHNIH